MSIGIACLLLASAACVAANDSDVSSSAISSFVTGYTLTQGRSAEMGLLGRLWDGHTMNGIRGEIGESIAERAFFGGSEMAHSKKGAWVSVAPRFGRQGIDHVFLRVRDDGIPNGMMLGESKYGAGKLGETKDGLQMGSRWRATRLAKIGDRYFEFSNSMKPVLRSRVVPAGAKQMDVYFTQTQKVTIWKSGETYYTDADGTITDEQLRKRSRTFGKYFYAASSRTITTRNFLFQIIPSSGDYLVRISNLTDDAKVMPETVREVRLPGELVVQGRVDTKTIKEALKRNYPKWDENKLSREAQRIKKVVSNQDFLNAGNARRQAKVEIARSSTASAGIAGGVALALSLGSEVFKHGTDVCAYDLKNVGGAVLEKAVSTGLASYCGQRVMLHLAGKTVLGRSITSTAASRIGGGVGAAVMVATSFYKCAIGSKNWREGAVDAGINAASMAAGHYAAVGMSAWMGGSTAATAASAGGGAAAGAGAGSAMVAGTASGGAAGVGGGMLMAASACVVAAATIAVAAGGYVVYDHYREFQRLDGELAVVEKRADLLMSNHLRYERAIDGVLVR